VVEEKVETQMSELTPEERQLLVMEAQWKGEKNREVHAAQADFQRANERLAELNNFLQHEKLKETESIEQYNVLRDLGIDRQVKIVLPDTNYLQHKANCTKPRRDAFKFKSTFSYGNGTPKPIVHEADESPSVSFNEADNTATDAPQEEPSEEAVEPVPAPAPAEDRYEVRKALLQDLMQAFDNLDEDGAELAPRLDLRKQVDGFVPGCADVQELSDSVRGLDAMIVEREEYEELVNRWIESVANMS